MRRLWGFIPLLVAILLSTSAAQAQLGSRDIALQALREGELDEMQGQLTLAAARYLDILDLDDSDHEFSDVRTVTMLRLGIVYVKKGDLTKGRVQFRKVADMKSAPDCTRKAAVKLLELSQGNPSPAARKLIDANGRIASIVCLGGSP